MDQILYKYWKAANSCPKARGFLVLNVINFTMKLQDLC